MAQSEVVRNPGFAKRINTACETATGCPPLHQGRLVWIREQFKTRFDVTLPLETIRKWHKGVSLPRTVKMQQLSTILGVDEAWLLLGSDADLPAKERRARNALADAAVNIVAGLIQMDGGNVAFPEEGDRRAARDGIDLHAIIKGGSYAIHVAAGEQKSDKDPITFVFQPPEDNVIVLGVVRVRPFDFDVYEIPAEVIASADRRKESIEIVAKDPSTTFRMIESFESRL